MLVLNIVDDWYITATDCNFLVGQWNGHTYYPKGEKTYSSGERFPKFLIPHFFDDLPSCFSFILKTYQIDAFYQAQSGKELIEILTNLKTSMEIISNALSDSFLKQQKEYKRAKKKDRG